MPDTDRLLILDPGDHRWTELWRGDPAANIFHHLSWLGLLQQVYGYRPFILALAGGAGLRAGLPCMEVHSPLTGRRWVSLPFSDHCAPLLCQPGDLAGLTNGLVAASETPGAPKLEVRAGLASGPGLLPYAPHVLHTVALGPDAAEVAARFHPTHRRYVRGAERSELRLVWGHTRADVEAFYRLHLITRRRQGAPIQPKRFFERLGSDLIEQGLGFVLLAYQGERCLAGAVFLHWQHTLTYKYGASDPEGLKYRPNYLIFWQAIRWGCEQGYTSLDLGRTDTENAGLRQFKSGWGGQETPLIYTALGSQPPRSPDGRLRRVMRAVIQNSPVWVCRITGELLYKHFG